MITVKAIQAAITFVNLVQATGVYENTYVSQIHPVYHVLETPTELAEFERLVDAVRKGEGLSILAALEELERFVDCPCETGNLRVLYRDGEWKFNPEGLLDEEFDRQQWEEDAEWFEAAREGFREMEDPTPTVADEPWRGKVVKLAAEIAAREGRAPEEADFNTAMIRLQDEIPPEELRLLQEDLRAVEEGRSW